MSEITASPLCWPPGWRRTNNRTQAKFGKSISVKSQYSENYYTQKRELTIEQATRRVLDELGRMGVPTHKVIISSDLKLRNDGLPYSGQATSRLDPGVAVYWTDGGRKRCMAIDRYTRIADNLAAIAATIEAMRAIERHGGAEILDRAFTGFVALAAPEQPFQVLGVGANASRDEVEAAYKRLAMKHHPDRGGNSDDMARINSARDALLGAT